MENHFESIVYAPALIVELYSKGLSLSHRRCLRVETVSPLSAQLWMETVSLFTHSHPPTRLLAFGVLTKISWHVYHVYSTFMPPRSGCDTAVTLFQDVSSAWNHHRCHTLAIRCSAAHAQGLKIFSLESCVYGCVCVSHLRDQAGPVGCQLFQILLFSRLCPLFVHLQTTTSCTQSQFPNTTAKSSFLLTDKGLIRKIKTL